ncbi:MAG: S8 family peptidase [Pseudomonadota bacterium]
MRAQSSLMVGALALTSALLTGCGGSGGAATNILPSAPTTQAATPTPTPTPVSFNTAEYRRSNGLDNINAIPAYEAGGTGEGVIIAIIDSGIDSASLEFTGRIHPASTNTAGTPSDFQDIDGHGTFVASVAAGAKNDSGTHGVAFEAQLLALRTDSGLSCQGVDGCSHFDSDIAEALDVARIEGARVANMSLGGGGANFQLRQAIDRATSDDVIVVISAGNDGQSQPDDFALAALDQRANGRVLIAGYVDDNNVIADSSNRAGSAQDVFVVAPGVSIRATGLNNEEFFVTGSSFSAPHVSGAVALLYDLFPNLTADEMIDLVTSTATDLGTPGVDPVYGHGLINLEEAIQPQGTLQTSLVSVNADTQVMGALVSGAAGPSAFGNALSAGLTSTTAVSYDRFNRAYDIPLAQFAQSAAPTLNISALFDTRQRFAHSALRDESGTIQAQFSMQQQLPLSADLLSSFSGSFADQADLQQVTAQMHVDLGNASVSTFVNQRPGIGLAPINDTALLSLADTDAAQFGLGSAPTQLRVVADYHLRGGWKVGMAAARSDTDFQSAELGGIDEAASMTQSGVSLAWENEAFAVRSTLGVIREIGQVFGAQANRGALSLGRGAQTRFAELAFSVILGGTWRLDGDAAYGVARLDNANMQSLIAAGNDVALTSWSAQLAARALLAPTDAFALTVRQPQRVESGTATFAALETLSANTATFSLAPDGRQMDFEAAYGVALPGLATLSANVLLRQDAGHVAGLNDVAALMRLTSRF